MDHLNSISLFSFKTRGCLDHAAVVSLIVVTLGDRPRSSVHHPLQYSLDGRYRIPMPTGRGREEVA